MVSTKLIYLRAGRKELQDLLEQLRNSSERCEIDKQKLENQVSTFEERLKTAVERGEDLDKVKRENTEIRISLAECKKDLNNLGEDYLDCQQKLNSKWF